MNDASFSKTGRYTELTGLTGFDLRMGWMLSDEFVADLDDNVWTIPEGNGFDMYRKDDGGTYSARLWDN